jgi:gliding motility-associated-like protein
MPLENGNKTIFKAKTNLVLTSKSCCRLSKTILYVTTHCIIVLFFCVNTIEVVAQSCPNNIDFETGTFDGWTCYTGSVSAGSGQNIMSLSPSSGPIPGKHTIYPAFPSAGTDPYGGFPINCPNGSGYSIRLGEARGGGQANGVSYDFTVPINQNEYNLTYNYAVVFQDPNHLEYQQPRLEIEILNITDNVLINCSSFSFHPFGTVLPGFMISPNPGGSTPVYYKEWSPVSVNLSGLAGKKIKLFFKVAGCTFSAHFGYAYIDVSSDCNGSLTGATFCAGDTSVKVTAPYGFQNYTWYDSTLTQVLGNQQSLTIQPAPVSGTRIAVKVEPYAGYGCPQILYVRLSDTLNIVANAGNNVLSCNAIPVRIGSLPVPGLVYSWQPTAGLSDPHISNPLADPASQTTYVLTVKSEGGGCTDTDSIVVRTGALDSSMQLIGDAVICNANRNAAVLKVQSADSIQWYRNNVAIVGANQTEITASITGGYHAMLFSNAGCSTLTRTQAIFNSSATPPVASFTTASSVTQCQASNQFKFTNTSFNASSVQYKWLMGNGVELSTTDAVYTYPSSGNYIVTLVTSNSRCTDSSELPVVVYQNATPEFTVDPICINTPAKFVNNTADTVGSAINYMWDFGNGQTSTLRTPQQPSYAVAGPYTVSLSVGTAQCPTPLVTTKRTIVVANPKPGITYPMQYAVVNLPLNLNARSLGKSYLWNPAINLDNRSIAAPIFKGTADQLYIVEIREPSGCVIVDTQFVKLVKNIEVYVPSAFTPNSDGKNDYLRPITMGLKELYHFKIFNRWGQLLFETKADKPGWDGRSKGVVIPAGTVVWTVEGLGADGKIYVRQGTSVLIR